MHCINFLLTFELIVNKQPLQAEKLPKAKYGFCDISHFVLSAMSTAKLNLRYIEILSPNTSRHMFRRLYRCQASTAWKCINIYTFTFMQFSINELILDIEFREAFVPCHPLLRRPQVGVIFLQWWEQGPSLGWFQWEIDCENSEIRRY